MGQCSFLPIALTWASSDYKDIVPGNCNITADTMDIRSGGSMSQSPTEVMEKVSLFSMIPESPTGFPGHSKEKSHPDNGFQTSKSLFPPQYFTDPIPLFLALLTPLSPHCPSC